MAKEELNKKITETKKSIVKKLEQEVVVVNQQIREVDKRCRQTENEIREVREVINKEITQVKEHQRTKLEENKNSLNPSYFAIRILANLSFLIAMPVTSASALPYIKRMRRANIL